MKTTILIPSYNEEKTIGDIVRKVSHMGFSVVVVDDGSTDNTKGAAERNGARVIRYDDNRGKGAALKIGFAYIVKNTDCDAVVVMDGDGQHNPEDIHRLITHAETHPDDIIIGNRMTRVEDMPVVRLLTNRCMSSFLSCMCGQRISDSQSGFRLVRRRVLESLELESNKYDLESEMLIKASRKNFSIGSTPIETLYRGEMSNIHPVIDTLRFIALVLKSLFRTKR